VGEGDRRALPRPGGGAGGGSRLRSALSARRDAREHARAEAVLPRNWCCHRATVEAAGSGAKCDRSQSPDRAGWRESERGARFGSRAETREGRDLRRPGRQAEIRESDPRMSEPRYEVYAIKYAHHARRASENFLEGLSADEHDGPMPLDYFVWLV